MIIRLDDNIFNKIIEFADETKTEVYVIGGFVRDLMLKRNSKDIDFVIIGNGIEFAQKLAKKINKRIKVNVFKNFGTANFRYGNLELEFVGARKESYNRYSRKPFVEDGTLEDDQKRRDFTINALAISLNKKNLFELLDPFDGIEDMKSKIIRTPLEPDITFSDDPLRMMRAIRFASQLDFDIHPDCFNAIKRNCERIEIVSMERISDELNKIVLSNHPAKGFIMLEETGLLKLIFPELYALKGVETINGSSHKDIFYHSLKVLENIVPKTDNLWLRWAALLHDIGKPKSKKFIDNKWTFHGHMYIGAKMIPNIFRRLKLPLNEKMKYVQKIVDMHHRPISLEGEEITDSAVRRLIYDAGEEMEDLFMLVESDITTRNEEKHRRILNNFKLLRERIAKVLEKDFIRNWQPPIDGKIIMQTFDIKPSKVVGELKEAVKDAILDGVVENSFDAAMNFLIKFAKEKYDLTPKQN